MNILQDALDENFGKDYEFLPLSFEWSKFLNFFFQGFYDITLSCVDEQFDILMKIVSGNLKLINEIYSSDFIFSRPQLCCDMDICPKGSVYSLKIGMLSKNKYKELSENS